jgi:hypothetical protein
MRLKAFTWGYHGWGSASEHFVRAVDALERRRGYRPPVFVDLRISRKVRARDFKDHAFESTVGARRYRWMRRLGNARILSHSGPRIQIAEPAAVVELLELLIELHGQRRRAILFCSCLEPELRLEDGLPSCHRVTVATLLLKAARRRGLRLEITEWPGGAVGSSELELGASALEAVLRGAAYVPLAPVAGRVSPEMTLPWGSRVRLRAGAEEAVIVSGPAYVRKGQWALEVVEAFEGPQADTKAERRAQQLLRVGYGPRSSMPAR